jgi:hypothetical protein
VGSRDFGLKQAGACDERTSKVTCYSTSNKLRGVSTFIETQDKMIRDKRGSDRSETLDQKLRLRDKVELKAQLLLPLGFIYSPWTVLLIIHETAE